MAFYIINKDWVLREVFELMEKVIKQTTKSEYMFTFQYTEIAWILQPLTIATYLQLGYTKHNEFFDTRGGTTWTGYAGR